MLTGRERRRFEQHSQGLDVTRLSEAFNALGEPNRCLLFRALLRGKSIRVGDLARIVDISAPLASQHLKVLLQAGLVTKQKVGTYVYYRADYANPLVGALREAITA